MNWTSGFSAWPTGSGKNRRDSIRVARNHVPRHLELYRSEDNVHENRMGRALANLTFICQFEAGCWHEEARPNSLR
jgi:hypothetical protein